jgi:hypothetical protein
MKAWAIALGLVVTVAAGATVGFWYGQSRAPAPNESPDVPDEPEVLVVERHEVPSSLETTPPAIVAAPVETPWIALNREAIAALEAGELDHALDLFEQCVAGDPTQATYRHNLAEALVRRALVDHEVVRPCPLCIERLARAVELAPERDALRELLARWRLEADTEKEFWTEGSQHFDLAYEGWRSEIIASSQSILDELERAYIDLSERFGVHPGELGQPRISVVLYRPAEFHSLTGLGHWAGAAFDGRIRVPIEPGKPIDKRLASLLRHELVHVFVAAAGGSGVPGWLNEGLAQWLQLDIALDLRSAEKSLAGQTLIPMDQLKKSLAQLGDDRRIAQGYAQSLLLCNFIAREYGDATLFKMVSGCKQGAAPATTFESWTKVSLDAAAGDLAEQLARSH